MADQPLGSLRGHKARKLELDLLLLVLVHLLAQALVIA